MINRVVALAELRTATMKYAKRLAVLAPEALVAAKLAINSGLDAAGCRKALRVGADVAQVGEPGLDPGVGERGIDLLVELIDDLGGRALGNAHAEPSACLEAGHEIGHHRQVRERLRARRRGHRQRAQLAGADVLDR